MFSFSLYSKTEYLQCDSFIIKIKKPLIGFDREYVRDKNKCIRVENIKFLEKKYFLYELKLIKKNSLTKTAELILKLLKVLIIPIFLIIKVL
ncbi:MAG: hypothetical protein CM15mP124_1720 [Alphaproteobacteria bacterium]|nr:MAG: hypothetical protein CM15mP124_1720 [Alphaproteobacteria bacterium]